MKKLTIGLLAHVDAGKTTLSEGILYTAGKIRNLGRVDHKDAYLDTDEMERERGITIFSKQAVFELGDWEITLLDTPGHVDFSAEMERTLQVLDCAVLVVSGTDGVQEHTRTLFRLLARYEVPVFFFCNKMDCPGTDREALLSCLQEKLGDGCVDFGKEMSEIAEAAALCEETALEEYLSEGALCVETLQRLIANRMVFPCYFGSALRLTGIDCLLNGIQTYAPLPEYPTAFGARVFKIARDEKNTRMTFLKVTGGALSVRQSLSGKSRTNKGEIWTEKIHQIRVYSGERFEAVKEAPAGTICAVTGLTQTYAGEGLGMELDEKLPVLEPVLSYALRLPDDCSPTAFLQQLRQLEEEEPELKLVWNEALGQIQAQLMGEVQIEVLQKLIRKRFKVDVRFEEGQIVYKETIQNTVEGVGHFEPLRHYAEVHLLLQPGENGSGVCVAADCSEDALAKNWQRLILTHLTEREHVGVLTGAALTDIVITLVAGKAHQKHTEGGDFRQATYRAIRQGLMKAQSVLLEPYYDFALTVPTEYVGRAMTDIEQMEGKCEPAEQTETACVLRGSAPVSAMRNYQKEVYSYTRGKGQLQCSLKGYYPCHNQQDVIERSSYDPDADTANPSGSVFCSHGAGILVPWNEVEEHMHLPLVWNAAGTADEEKKEYMPDAAKQASAEEYFMGEEEVRSIVNRISGANKSADRSAYKKTTVKRTVAAAGSTRAKPQKKRERYLLVDGYNIVFAWEELNALAKTNIDAARGRLMDILCNYQAYDKCTLILVFDAYRVKGNIGSMTDYHNIHVVYTKEAETADQYIEKLAHQIGHDYDVTVATSDGLEQLIIRGQGCRLLSARELYREVQEVERKIREFL